LVGLQYNEQSKSVKIEKQRRRKMEKLIRFLKDEDGVTAIEYGLIAALIAVVIIVAVTLVGTELSDTFNEVGQNLAGAGS
jgi:pilus assembly protein Flp/PilA